MIIPKKRSIGEAANIRLFFYLFSSASHICLHVSGCSDNHGHACKIQNLVRAPSGGNDPIVKDIAPRMIYGILAKGFQGAGAGAAQRAEAVAAANTLLEEVGSCVFPQCAWCGGVGRGALAGEVILWGTSLGV